MYINCLCKIGSPKDIPQTEEFEIMTQNLNED